ncbi:DUF1028 domain-containing protein [Fluviispira vulneris]|uniref:DUF1028 domain-containing protein n=1 Tax=Fluviispira vulneris TaxID=2763012 RepID=UPI001644C00F|nr:DUF1028 domain-containing protein [Fluviispira vulneris]
MHILSKFIFSLLALTSVTKANATFSIIAIDKMEGKFGAAFASCISLQESEKSDEKIKSFIEDQLHVYVPGKGIMNLQGAVINVNLLNSKAKDLIYNAKNAKEIINDLINYEETVLTANDNYSKFRQFLALTFDSTKNIVYKNAYTGMDVNSHSGDLTGANERFAYVIAGNYLTQKDNSTQNDVIKALSDGFENESKNQPVNLSDKLIAALQNVKSLKNIGDIRCVSSYGTTSNFAFMRTYKGDETLENYVTYSNPSEQKDGIDSLISLYNKKAIPKRSIN